MSTHKHRLLLEGRVKTNKVEILKQGIDLFVPTKEGIRSWKEQSETLGRKIKHHREKDDAEELRLYKEKRENMRQKNNRKSFINTKG